MWGRRRPGPAGLPGILGPPGARCSVRGVGASARPPSPPRRGHQHVSAPGPPVDRGLNGRGVSTVK